jgi:hypothetical protein
VLAGEGGALALCDAGDIERAEILREKGTNRAKFFRGEVDKYTWVDVGSSLLPSEIVAAYLCAQLEHCDEITAQRLRTWEHYAQALAPLAQQGLVRLPCVPAECRHNGHMFYVILADAAQRDPFLAYLKQRGVQAGVPLRPTPHLADGASVRWPRGPAAGHGGSERAARPAALLLRAHAARAGSRDRDDVRILPHGRALTTLPRRTRGRYLGPPTPEVP